MLTSLKKIQNFIRYKTRKKFLYKELPKITSDSAAKIAQINPWAFMRVRNEMRTLPACLNSILPIIKRGVIAYNPSSDKNEELFILEFCKINKGFIPLKYDYDVIPAHNHEYLTNQDKNRRLDTYYNKALSVIPDEDWLIKIDADQIYDTKRLAQLISMARENQVISIARINLNIVNNKLRLLKKEPCVDPIDHWLIKKVPEMHFSMNIFKESENQKFRAFEGLNLHQIRRKYGLQVIHTNPITWHFPHLKPHRQHNIENIPITNFQEILDQESINKIQLEMLDEKYIIKFLKQVGFKDPPSLL